MTGYGKAECICDNNKITVEIRSVNGKAADISLKTQIIPREREIEVRQLLANKLQRGNIDLFALSASAEENPGRTINQEVVLSYVRQLRELANAAGENPGFETLLASALRFPEVFENATAKEENQELLNENWDKIFKAIDEAATMLTCFRKTEGKRLQEDLSERVMLITKYLDQTESFDHERIESVKSRLGSKIQEALDSPDMNRFEQEMIYYLEKLDITEEKVRLAQHCRYFLETMETEEYPGKKLGFIAQEMGREINTLGSKANHAGIQQIVVRMKDEFEKIKEQSLNIL